MSSSTTTSVEGTESESAITQYLAEHPRMMGALFTILLLLSQAGAVAAGDGFSISGP